MANWLTVTQAAAYTGFSARTIRQRIHDGDLPAYMPRGSRLLRIERADLDDMIAGRESLTARIRRVLDDHGGELPPLSDEQIRALARLLPRPSAEAGEDDHNAA
jgi:excisionase family DNA binding protein